MMLLLAAAAACEKKTGKKGGVDAAGGETKNRQTANCTTLQNQNQRPHSLTRSLTRSLALHAAAPLPDALPAASALSARTASSLARRLAPLGVLAMNWAHLADEADAPGMVSKASTARRQARIASSWRSTFFGVVFFLSLFGFVGFALVLRWVVVGLLLFQSC